MAQTAEADMQGLLGLAAVVLFVVAVVCGWPASGWALALIVLHWIVNAGAKAIGTTPEAALPVGKLVLKGALAAAGKAAFWAAIASAIVWVVQLAMRLGFENIDPDAMYDVELRIADFASSVRAATSPIVMAAVFVLMIALSVAVGGLWPIGATARIKKAAGGLLALVTSLSAFSFVGANVAGEHYDKVGASIRAQIVGQLGEIAAARREAAAFHWLTDIIEKSAASVRPAKSSWQTYLNAPLFSCRRVEDLFDQGYDKARRGYAGRESTYCDTSPLVQRLAAERLRIDPPAFGSSTGAGWLADFAPLLSAPASPVDMVAQPSVDLVPTLSSITDLRALARRVQASLNDANAARDAVRGTATGAANKLLKGVLPGDIGDIVSIWSGALLDVLGKKSDAQVARWFGKTRAGQNATLAMLAGIDPEGAALVPPPDSGAESLGLAVLDAQMKAIGRPLNVPADELVSLGRRTAQFDDTRDTAEAKAQAEAARVRAEAAEKARIETRRYEVEHPRIRIRVP